jgi:hypothetical protein
VLGSLPAVALIIAWKYIAAPNSWLEIFTVAVAAMIVTVIGSWLLSLSELERKRILHMLALPQLRRQ